MPQVLTPGPDHPIVLHRSRGRVRALFRGHLLADSADTVLLREAGYPDRYYFPREGVEMEVISASAYHTYSPYAGQASYFSVYRDSKIIENIAWSYEQPHPALERIAGMLSFDLDEVEIQLDEAAALDASEQTMAEYIRHTDSGAGASQAQHWTPNVDQ